MSSYTWGKDKEIRKEEQQQQQKPQTQSKQNKKPRKWEIREVNCVDAGGKKKGEKPEKYFKQENIQTWRKKVSHS